jgi:hypothetical protein
MKALLALSFLLTMAPATAPAAAVCDRREGQPVRLTGTVDGAWLDRAGNAVYLLDAGDPSCITDGYESYIEDPGGRLACGVGQHLTVEGRFEPVTYDFTGSGYFIRAERVTCR